MGAPYRPKKPKVKTEPDFFDNFAEFSDAWFDWFGYEEIPHSIRYSIVLFILVSPLEICFFFYCCVHNDEYDDEEEERLFKKRVLRAEARKEKRLAEVAHRRISNKWD